MRNENKIPIWLWASFYTTKPLTVEEEQMCYKIMDNLKKESEFYHWDPSIIEKVMYVNKHDDMNMYGGTPLKIKK